MRCRAWVAVLFAAAASACDHFLTNPAQYGAVQAIVQRPDGTPLANVQLELYTGFRPMSYAATASDGRFLFTNVPSGGYVIRAIRPIGYRSCVPASADSVADDSAPFTVAPQSHDTVAFTMALC